MQSTEVQPQSPLISDTEVHARRRRGLLFLGIACAAVGCTMALQLGLNANFVVDEMHLSGQQQGILEGFRESCGILALGVLALMAWMPEPIIAALMLVLLGLGVGSYTYVDTFTWLIISSVIWSQGLHVWMPLPNSMTLALAEPGKAGHRLGQIQAAGNVGSAAGLIVALVLTGSGFHLRPMYLIAGAAALLGCAACFGIPRQMKAERPRLVFKRKYSLYYLLCFLEGWRKQICLTFAGYLLVKKYGTPPQTMLLLWIAINAAGWFVAPRVGRWIDRAGEKRTLVFYYISLTAFFVSYALIESRYFLWALFIVDNVFFVFTMALTTYVNRIAPQEEHTPTLSMGVAMNHIAAVTMPLVGGLLWDRFGYKWAFLTGVITAALSIVVAQKLPSRERLAEAPALAAPAGAK
ncbi:MAG TPA: MFS transporter [Planctomycetota bacterium]|jgi:MFS family permease